VVPAAVYRCRLSEHADAEEIELEATSVEAKAERRSTWRRTSRRSTGAGRTDVRSDLIGSRTPANPPDRVLLTDRVATFQ
jgi:hypothetical protein